MTRVLIIDPQFEDDPDIEREVAGEGVAFEIVRPGDGEVPAGPLREADAVVNCRSRHRLPAHLVAEMRRAKVVVQAGVGFNHIDIEACARRGIPVCNTPDYGTLEVADHTLGLLLALTRGTTAYHRRLLRRDDAWSTKELPVAPVRRMRGRVFGIVGLGRIGLAVAARAAAFRMRVAFHDPWLPAGVEHSLGYRRTETLDELLGRSDVVSLHCPLTPETARLVDDRAIAAMKPDAILINTSRGGTVDIDAVERGLRSGKLLAAALDVLPVEPLDRSHPLIAAWSREEAWLEGRLVLTPHAAFYTPESLADMRRLSMLAVVRFLREGRLRSCVNLDALRANGHEPEAVRDGVREELRRRAG
ncbi:MAG: C-terminal binding protein [Immundisolibacterales bacterium]|nr:C-terminal binding protein [Immundisolibacterales bacterium]